MRPGSVPQWVVSTWWVLATCFVAGGGCSLHTEDAPRAGTCDPFQVVTIHPASGAIDVAPEVTLAVTFNDFPDPDSVDATTLRLFTGLFYHTGHYAVDLVERQGLFRPSGPLSSGLGYTVIVAPGIRSLRGCLLAPPPPTDDGMHPTSYSTMFQTLTAGLGRPVPPPVAPPTYADVVTLFGAHCAGGGCHLDSTVAPTDDAACLAGSIQDLSLCARDARGALVGIPSRQVDRLVRVVPGDSSRSYMMRKLVGAPPLVGHVGSPRGDLSVDDLRLIRDWIDAGAPGD